MCRTPGKPSRGKAWSPLNSYKTKDVTVRINAEPIGAFVQVQLAIMMSPEHATQFIEAVSELNGQVPGDAEPERKVFVENVIRELAGAACKAKNGTLSEMLKPDG